MRHVSHIEQSRTEWGYSDGRSPSDASLQVGCLQRIAASLESIDETMKIMMELVPSVKERQESRAKLQQEREARATRVWARVDMLALGRYQRRLLVEHAGDALATTDFSWHTFDLSLLNTPPRVAKLVWPKVAEQAILDWRAKNLKAPPGSREE